MARISKRQRAIQRAIERLHEAVPNPEQSDQARYSVMLSGAEVFAILPLLEEFLNEPVDASVLSEED